MLRQPYILGGPQIKGDEIRSGYLIPTFSGAQKRAEMLRQPRIHGGPKTKGDEIRSGYIIRTFSGPKKRRKSYVKPAFLGVTKQKGMKSEVATSPLPSGAQNRAEMLRQPCILGGPKTKEEEMRCGYLTPTFTGAQKRAEMQRQPCILGGPQTTGGEIRSGYLTLPSRGPKRGRKCYVNPAFAREEVCFPSRLCSVPPPVRVSGQRPVFGPPF